MTLNGIVEYPPELDTDSKRLSALYRLLEELRIEHNRVGDIARADWVRHEGRWQAYRNQFDTNQSPLLIEQRRLKDLIRRANYTDVEWKKVDLSDSDYELLFGDKGTLRELPTPATTLLVDELKAIDFLALKGEFVDPLQDWTTYTEVDTSSILTVAANQITVINLTRSSESWVYADKGVNHFGTTGIDHDISSEGTDFDGGNSDIFIYAIANINNPTNTTDPIIMVKMIDRLGTNMRYRLEIDDGATDELDLSIDHDLATQYWLTITREAAGSIAKTYTDSVRTSLKDTMTVAQGSTSFQYMVHAFSRAGSGTEQSNGFIYDLDLKEAITAARRRVAFGAGWAARR